MDLVIIFEQRIPSFFPKFYEILNEINIVLVVQTLFNETKLHKDKVTSTNNIKIVRSNNSAGILLRVTPEFFGEILGFCGIYFGNRSYKLYYIYVQYIEWPRFKRSKLNWCVLWLEIKNKFYVNVDL